MHELIKTRLSAIAEQRDIRILYACESGSRAWGFASPDSDYDVRFLYVHPAEHYLGIDDKKDSIELPLSDELDINGWDIRKALRLVRKSNAVIFEWLQSPVVYYDTTSFAQHTLHIAKAYFSPQACMHHYMGLAFNSFRALKDQDTVRLKKYFYVIRPALAALWITRYNSVPPMEYARLLPLLDDMHILRILDELLEAKTAAAESDLIPPVRELHTYLEQVLALCEEHAGTLQKKETDIAPLNQYFRSFLYP